MTSAHFFFAAVAFRSFRWVENADDRATSQYNLLIDYINTFSTYDVTPILHRVPSGSQGLREISFLALY